MAGSSSQKREFIWAYRARGDKRQGGIAAGGRCGSGNRKQPVHLFKRELKVERQGIGNRVRLCDLKVPPPGGSPFTSKAALSEPPKQLPQLGIN